MRSIGIFGGSFNPIHCGHIALAQEILRQTPLDEIWLMVSPQNPLKQQADLLADDERLRLAQKALKGVEGIHASDFEFRLPRPSYTWHTLETMRQAYPDCQFSLIIGGDNWQHFNQWYHADDILNHYPIIVYPRHAMSPTPHPSLHTPHSTLHEHLLILHDLPLFDVSSTQVRQRVKNGESIDALVPDAIIDDVKRLYS